MSAILSTVYCTKTVFWLFFLACQYVLHCVYSGLPVIALIKTIIQCYLPLDIGERAPP